MLSYQAFCKMKLPAVLIIVRYLFNPPPILQQVIVASIRYLGTSSVTMFIDSFLIINLN